MSTRRLLLDTSTLIEIQRGRLTLPARFDGVLSIITATELLIGVERDTSNTRARAFAEAALSTLEVLPVDLAVAREAARLVATLRGIGQTLNAADALIAATALVHGLPVVTLDRDFDAVRGLTHLHPYVDLPLLDADDR